MRIYTIYRPLHTRMDECSLQSDASAVGSVDIIATDFTQLEIFNPGEVDDIFIVLARKART